MNLLASSVAPTLTSPPAKIFGTLNLGFIIVYTPGIKINVCIPANTTAAPLAASLGLVPDGSCRTDDDADVDCAGDLLREIRMAWTMIRKRETASPLPLYKITPLRSIPANAVLPDSSPVIVVVPESASRRPSTFGMAGTTSPVQQTLTGTAPLGRFKGRQGIGIAVDFHHRRLDWSLEVYGRLMLLSCGCLH
ncbi:hypothetical protein B0H19DRAFT_1084277 [Mycena capillaripes]|nr:hypothetical protein B0H19DRAFT_1084277 [Mycena capillaripes]